MEGSGIPEAPHSSKCVRPFSTTGNWAGHEVIRGKPDGKSVSVQRENGSKVEFKVTSDARRYRSGPLV